MPDPPQIAIDIQALQAWSSRGRGIGRYIHEQVNALLSDHPERVHSLLISPHRPVTPEVETFIETGLVRPHGPVAPRLPSGTTPDVYYMTSPLEWDFDLAEMWPRWARHRSVKTVATLYDVIPLVYPDRYLADPAMRARYWARIELIRQADLLLCISESTAADAHAILGIDEQRAVTIGTGVSQNFTVPPDPRPPPGYVIPGAEDVRTPYIMYTGGIDYRKNLTALLEAYALLPSEIRWSTKLVIVCRVLPAERDALMAEAAALGIADLLVLTGFVSDNVLLHLYRYADLFVFPSLYEGFGLPIAEAIMSGTLAIASDSSSMIELVTDPARRFDPSDPGDIAGCIVDALHAPASAHESQSDYVADRFTWADVAGRTIAAITRLPVGPQEQSRKHARRHTRARVAIISPLPPDESGIADYTWRLVRELAMHVDVDLVAEDPMRHPPPPAGNIEIVGIEGFRFRDILQPYDDIVYAMGNSSHHGNAYELMATNPGTVMLHEVRFTDFFGWYTSSRGLEPASFHGLLLEEHEGLEETTGANGWVSPEDAAADDIYLTGPILDRATRIVTTSSYGAELARLQRPERSTDITNVGYGYAVTETVDRDPDVQWLATFGHQDHIKATDLVLEAFTLIGAEFPDLRLAIVGSVDPGFRSYLETALDQTDLSTRVTLTGRVGADAYESWLRRADIAVQLRRSTNGEVSGAVADCLRFGVPTIVSELGAAQRLPDSVVVRTPVPTVATTLASSIRALITNPDVRSMLSKNATDFAARRGFHDAALRLLTALDLN